MESPQSKKINDKCYEINSGTTGVKIIFEHEEEIDTLGKGAFNKYVDKMRGEGHCVLKWVLHGHFLGIKMSQ